MCDPPPLFLGPVVWLRVEALGHVPGTLLLSPECGQRAHVSAGTVRGAGLSYSPGMLEGSQSPPAAGYGLDSPVCSSPEGSQLRGGRQRDPVIWFHSLGHTGSPCWDWGFSPECAVSFGNGTVS